MELEKKIRMHQTFYLARHGETQWNTIKRLQGRLDSPLTERGKLQAQVLGQSLQNQGIELIVSSALFRAANTAASCQQILGCPHHIIEDLTET